MLYSVSFLCLFSIVPFIHCADQIAGDSSDPFKAHALTEPLFFNVTHYFFTSFVIFYNSQQNNSLAEINSSAKFGNLGSMSIGEAINVSTIPDVVLYVHGLLSDYMTCVAWVNVNLSAGGSDSILIIGGRQSASRGRYFCTARTTNNIYNCRLTSESEVTVTTVTISS